MKSQQKIVIIDYGMGNLGSVRNMIRYLGYEPLVSSAKKDIEIADKLILPGVGHFAKAMQNLRNNNLIDTIRHQVIENKIPILGICLGMQLLCNYSEEGNVEGIGLIDAEVKKFNFLSSTNLKIPHMGWNKILKRSTNSVLFENIKTPSRFYFVHSYYVDCKEQTVISAETEYGILFTSAFTKKNIHGVQFHPEKSHQFGIDLFQNFLNTSK